MAEISREELKEHCIKQMDMCKKFANMDNTSLNGSRVYQEHKMVLDMIEKLEKIEKVIDTTLISKEPYKAKIETIEQILRGGE